MHSTEIAEVAASIGAAPVSWVAATQDQTYLNLGDALSPLMVAMLSGLPIFHEAHRSDLPRLAAVGTIAHSFEKGSVSVWGTGTSANRNPLHHGDKIPFVPSADTAYKVYATRGPVTRAILKEENAVGPAAFGDPVWALPRFYAPKIEKKYDLGVIVHLSDLVDRSLDAQPKPEMLRYEIPEEFEGRIKIINTVTDVSLTAMKDRLDEILSCRRLVSTSLHGLVFAESYGIPCLYFAPRGAEGKGLQTRPMDPNDGYDLRITDLYLGVGRTSIPIYHQPRRQRTDWAKLMAAIDTAWEPIDFDLDPLLEAFPLPYAPISAEPGKTIFDHPAIKAVPLRHGQPSPARDLLRTLWRKKMAGAAR